MPAPRAFGFRKAQFDLRNKVLSAYYDYALNAELIRLEQANAELLQTMAMVVDARNRAGAAGQQDLLKARNELDLSRNDIANMQSQLPAQRAALNALLGREPDAPLPPPDELPPQRPMSYSDAQLWSWPRVRIRNWRRSPARSEASRTESNSPGSNTCPIST